jgi:hypothetical protein
VAAAVLVQELEHHRHQQAAQAALVLSLSDTQSLYPQ